MSSPLTKSNDKLLWAFTEGARQAIDTLVGKGFDRDLAIAMLESLFGESIYDIGEEEVQS